MSSLPRRSTASSSGGLSAPLSLYDVHNLSYVKSGSNIITIYKNKFRKLEDTWDTEDTGDMGDTGGTVETGETWETAWADMTVLRYDLIEIQKWFISVSG